MSIHYVQSMCTADTELPVWDVTGDFTEMWGISAESLRKNRNLPGRTGGERMLKMTRQGLPWWFSDKEIWLPMQVTQIRSLVQEDPTRHWATTPVGHKYWTHVP